MRQGIGYDPFCLSYAHALVRWHAIRFAQSVQNIKHVEPSVDVGHLAVIQHGAKIAGHVTGPRGHLFDLANIRKSIFS